MKTRPLFLLTNDDGIQSLGLASLWKALHTFADCVIAAPTQQRSGSGLSITFDQPIYYHYCSTQFNNLSPAIAVEGTPADCVKVGLHVLCQQKPDLVLSGINHGSNAGRSVLYSGTVGGVIEGVFQNISGIAFSHLCDQSQSLDHLGHYIQNITKYALQNPLPIGTFWNVNIPKNTTGVCQMAVQSLAYWIDQPHITKSKCGKMCFSMASQLLEHEESSLHSDTHLLKKDVISVVPIHINQLTDQQYFENTKADFDAAMEKESHPVRSIPSQFLKTKTKDPL